MSHHDKWSTKYISQWETARCLHTFIRNNSLMMSFLTTRLILTDKVSRGWGSRFFLRRRREQQTVLLETNQVALLTSQYLQTNSHIADTNRSDDRVSVKLSQYQPLSRLEKERITIFTSDKCWLHYAGRTRSDFGCRNCSRWSKTTRVPSWQITAAGRACSRHSVPW